MYKSDLKGLENNLGYHFKDPELFDQALRHSSYVNEHLETQLEDNERLEFLGDAVLSLVVGHILMRNYPESNEGNLSRMRANLVNETQLAEIAREIDLGAFIRLGKGELNTCGFDKNSILSNTLEALIAAIYLDGGFETVFKQIERHFLAKVKKISAESGDYKSKLQELLQMQQKAVPSYKVVDQCGPDHDKTFRVQLTVDHISVEGEGKSKKLAEQAAAQNVLKLLEAE